MSVTLYKAFPSVTPEYLVDELGAVKAQIADLEAREKSLRDQLVETGLDEADGFTFRATISRGTVNKTDWRSVVESLEQTPALKCRVTKATTESDRITVKVVSR